ncbi:MAG: bactofilin family protein [Ignavibacteria bacterium]
MFGSKQQKTSDATTFISKSEDSQIKTLISEGCRFDGNLFSPTNTKIEGLVNGNLNGERGLIIGKKGSVNGDVSSIEVVVYGTIKGNIRAHSIEIKSTGIVQGDIETDSLVIEQGGKLNGGVKMRETQPESIQPADSEAFTLPEEPRS